MLLAPAYNVTEEDVRYIVDTTAAAITKFFKAYLERKAGNGINGVNGGVGDVA